MLEKSEGKRRRGWQRKRWLDSITDSMDINLMQRADSLEKTLVLGKVEGKRRRGWHRMKWLDSVTDCMDMNLSKLWEIVKDRGA